MSSINFVDIKGFEGKYKINRNGEIYSCYHERLMKTNAILAKRKNKEGDTGYKCVRLYYSSYGSKCYLLHRLVAETFIPNPENKPQVNHIDGNKLNNSIENLEWVTAKEQRTHAFKIGIQKPCYRKNRMFTKEQVLKMIELKKEGLSYPKIGKIFGINNGNAYRYINGLLYKDLHLKVV